MKILHIIYCCSVFMSNPINIFPVYENLLTYKKLSEFLKNLSTIKSFCFWYFLWVMIVVISVVICIYVPNFITFIEIIGSVLFPILGIFIPVN